MKENVPVLMWYPYASSIFGVGGEAPPALCKCGAEMSWVGLFPWHDATWGLAYCFACAPLEGHIKAKARMGQGKGMFVLHVEPSKQKDISKKMGSSFVGLRAVAGAMSETPIPRQHLKGVGVYSQGISPTHPPNCPECERECSVVVHIDSLTHEDLQWGDLASLVVWACPLHPTEAFFKVVDQD